MGEHTNKQQLFKQGFSYVLVGGSSALLELGVFQLLYEVFHANLALSNVTAAVIAMLYNFLLNRNVTFKSSSNPVRSAALFLLLWFFNLFVTTNAIGFFIGLGLHSALAKLITQGIVVIWNFFLYRKFIFV